MKKLPPIETRFKPGQSGNPSGGPKTPEEIKKLRKLSAKQFKEIGEMVVLGTWDELKVIAKDDKQSVLKRKLAQAIIEEKYNAFDEILNRIIGKVKESVEIAIPKPTIIRRPNGEVVELGAELEDKDE